MEIWAFEGGVSTKQFTSIIANTLSLTACYLLICLIFRPFQIKIGIYYCIMKCKATKHQKIILNTPL